LKRKVSIIILNYNGKEFLNDCLNSVIEQSFSDFEIIFIDNASTDGSYEFISENFKETRIKSFRTEKNLGFAGGNNYGLKQCGGDYIVLLNNDTIVEKDWLKYLVEIIQQDTKTGIAQSLVYTEGIPLKYYEKNGTVNLFGHNIMEVFDINDEGIGDIIQATGCSLIVCRELIEKTGGLFPDEYFLYAEDTYLSLKAKFAGYNLLHTSKSIVHHKGSGTTGKQIPSKIYFYQERNRLLNFFLFFDTKFIIKYIPLFVLNYKLKFFYCLFSKKYSLRGLFRSYFWFIFNIGWMKNERRKIKNFKIKNDNDILKLISCKMFNGNNTFERFMNKMLLLYCRITRIKVLENAK